MAQPALNASCTYVSIQFVYAISNKNRGRRSNLCPGRLTGGFDHPPRGLADEGARI
jgi:hypothetical protein